MGEELILAGVLVEAQRTLSSKVSARFIAEGSGSTERVWLEVTAPTNAYPVSLHERLAGCGWYVPATAVVVPERVESGPAWDDTSRAISSWAQPTWGWDEVTMPYAFADPQGQPVSAPKSAIHEARQVLKFVGIGRSPITRRTWRDLV